MDETGCLRVMLTGAGLALILMVAAAALIFFIVELGGFVPAFRTQEECSALP